MKSPAEGLETPKLAKPKVEVDEDNVELYVVEQVISW
jgi:hypothetical protein